MLSIAKVGRGRQAYYLSTVESLVAGAPGAPRSSGPAGSAARAGLVEPDGVWLGRAADGLGLAGTVVAPPAIDAVLSGADPNSGELLDPLHARVRVAAFDYTFAPPKSVSLLHALGRDEVAEQVRQGHESAVRDVLGYLDQHAARVRRTIEGNREVRAATGLVSAGFVHRTSRANDPHLHTHLLIANLAEERGGRWSALDGRALYMHASTAGLLYAASLRHELGARLGVRFGGPGPFADIAGVDRSVVEAFSTRSAAIARALAHDGVSGPRAARRAADRTRPEKDVSTPYDDLVAQWRERAYSLGVSDNRVASLAPGPGRWSGIGSPSAARSAAPSAGWSLAPDGSSPVEKVAAAVSQRPTFKIGRAHV